MTKQCQAFLFLDEINQAKAATVKDDFYNQLSAVTQSVVPPHDILAILGDFNAVSGTVDNGCKVVGPFGSGSPNDNTDLLTTYCALNDLTILGS